MKTKFNPLYVLLMLQEVKKMSDKNSFNSQSFLKKYPSFNSFKKILISKGLFEKKQNSEKWVGIEPNLIMAKAVLAVYLDNKKQASENKKMDSAITKEEYKIDSEKTPYIESIEKENSELKLKLRDLKEQLSYNIKVSENVIEDKDKKISELERLNAEAKNANSSLRKQIGEIQNGQFLNRGNIYKKYEDLGRLFDTLSITNNDLKNELNNKETIINALKKELQSKCDLLEERGLGSSVIEELSNLNKENQEQKNKITNFQKEIEEKDSRIQKLKSTISTQNPDSTKKIKVFGIPVYSSETKHYV